MVYNLKDQKDVQKLVDKLRKEYDLLIPTCPHDNGLLVQVLTSPTHLAVGSENLQCQACKRKYKLVRKP